MNESQNILHALFGLIASMVGGVLTTLLVKIRPVVDPAGALKDANTIPTASELEIERHHGWTRTRLTVFVLVLTGAAIIVFTWRTPQVRVIMTCALLAGCAVVPLAMQSLLQKELNKGPRFAIVSFPMSVVLICAFVSPYILLPPDLSPPPNSPGGAPSNIVSPSPDISAVVSTPHPDGSSTASPPSTESTTETAQPATPEPTVQPTPNEQAILSRLRRDLASKDASTRVGAFKTAIDSGDDAQRNTATQMALTTPYSDVRSLVVAGAIRSASSFVVHITHTNGDSDSTALLEKIGRDIEVRIEDFDKSKNTFIASTSASGVVATVGGPPFPHNRPSHISGERLSFSFDIARVVPGSGCTGVVLLTGAAGKMTGTMHCTGNYTANYAIEINIATE